jgi:hypothetical protein
MVTSERLARLVVVSEAPRLGAWKAPAAARQTAYIILKA